MRLEKARQLGWFVAIWAGSILALGVVAGLIRMALKT